MTTSFVQIGGMPCTPWPKSKPKHFREGRRSSGLAYMHLGDSMGVVLKKYSLAKQLLAVVVEKEDTKFCQKSVSK